MSTKFDREGLFRGNAIDASLGKTGKGGFPQLVLKVLANEIYNEAEGEWQEWDYEMGCTGYLCLAYTKDGEAVPSFSHEQVMDALKWDGTSYAGLAKLCSAIGQSEGVPIQFRMIEDDYENAKFDFKLQAIFPFDAPPTRELKQLDAAEIKDLDTQFGAMLAGKKKPATAKSNKTKGKGKATPPKAGAGKTKPLAPSASSEDKLKANEQVNDHVAQDAEEREARELAKVAKREKAKKDKAKKTGPPSVGSKKTTVAPAEDMPTCTHEEAWAAMVEARENCGLGEGTAAEAYSSSIFAIMGEGFTDDQMADVTEAQWAEIRDAAVVQLNDQA